MVLVASTCGAQPDSATMRHLERMGDLHGINTVIVALAGVGGAESTTKALQRVLSSANGTIVKLLALYNQAPNEGNKSAIEIAEQAGSEITP